MTNNLTAYDKMLIEKLCPPQSALTASQLMESLVTRNLLDQRRCRALLVQDFVDDLVKKGSTKIDAMYVAAEKFCCSYENVRKYIYYYKQ